MLRPLIFHVRKTGARPMHPLLSDLAFRLAPSAIACSQILVQDIVTEDRARTRAFLMCKEPNVAILDKELRMQGMLAWQAKQRPRRTDAYKAEALPI